MGYLVPPMPPLCAACTVARIVARCDPFAPPPPLCQECARLMSDYRAMLVMLYERQAPMAHLATGILVAAAIAAVIWLMAAFFGWAL